MTFAEHCYRAALAAARVTSPLLGRGDSKLARGIRGRRGAVDRISAWAAEARDPTKPLVWFHAPSVGEGLQARAVLEALRHLRPEAQTVFTHFSPSAEGLARAMPADVADYFPWDLAAHMRRLFSVLEPSLIAFTKTEVWPTLSALAARARVPTALIAATLPDTSTRRGPLARWLLGPSYGRLEAVLAIAEEDAANLEELGARPGPIRVTGDPAIDSAAQRAAAADPTSPYLAPFQAAPAPTLVAGSTWPEDEAVLVPAVSELRRRLPDLRLVVAPHEPHDAHVAALSEALAAANWRVSALGALEERGTLHDVTAVVVDRVGVLAHLYTVATVAYVGGGFGTDGLHSVLEPAAAGVPVVFGPRHANARAAADLLREGGGAEVRDPSSLTSTLDGWLRDEGARKSASEAARGYIERHRGAARRSADALSALISFA